MAVLPDPVIPKWPASIRLALVIVACSALWAAMSAPVLLLLHQHGA